MSSKYAKRAHFDDISYNVFNRRKFSFLMLEVSKFVTKCQQLLLKKTVLPGFGVTEYGKSLWMYISSSHCCCIELVEFNLVSLMLVGNVSDVQSIELDQGSFTGWTTL